MVIALTWGAKPKGTLRLIIVLLLTISTF
ncbi:cytochrome c oxidase subunit 2A [Trichormus azollae]